MSPGFSSAVPGNLVINIEKTRLKGAWGCSPQLRTFGTGIPAAPAIYLHCDGFFYARSICLLQDQPKRQLDDVGIEGTSWNMPQALRCILPGISGSLGVTSHIVDCIGRGQVKSGRKKNGIHDPYIDAIMET
ncbi:hypothetical protein N7454_004527 [Penicillium verhagenii]|nr:hypothetical protein N7454_004527 [Penicillium verhagenii]